MMKILGIVIVVMATAFSAFSAENLLIADRGKDSKFVIMISAEAGECVRYAAEELKEYVCRQTGVTLDIVTDTGLMPAHAVIVGPTRYSDALGAKLVKGERDLGEDGFRISVVDGHLLIAGSPVRGVLYGVYEFLEKFGGCGFYTPWREKVPRLERLEVAADYDNVQVPAFKLRTSGWGNAMGHQKFAAKIRANGKGWFPEEKKTGGYAWKFSKKFGNCHTFKEFISDREYFKDHPEYFSEINGVRRSGKAQLCLTNPDVLRIVTEKTLAELVSDPETRFIGISQNDWFNNCQCASCKAIDDEEGSPSGSMLRFVNAVAEEVEKHYPEVMVETLAYQYTRKPPKKTKPRHNVVPCLCTIECSFSRPLGDEHDWWNRAFMEDLKAWSRISSRLYLWNYTANYLNYLHPTPNELNFAADLKTFRENRVEFMFEEGASGADFASLKCWLLAKLMWNPDLDTARLIDEFMNAVYLKAAPVVKRYFQEAHDFAAKAASGRNRNDGYRLNTFEPDRNNVFPTEFLRRSIEDLGHAIELVNDDPKARVDVKMVRLSPLSMYLDRMAAKAKWIWVTDTPERFEDGSRHKVLADWYLQTIKMGEGWMVGRSISLANTKELHAIYIDAIKRMVESARPSHGCRKVSLGMDVLKLCNARYGVVVDDSGAEGGKALKANPDANGAAVMELKFAHVAFDEDAKYRVRARIRVDGVPGGKGEAFVLQMGKGRIAPDVAGLQNSYQWYEFEPMKLSESDVLTFSCGLFKNGGGACAVKGVYLDRVEIIR